MTTTATATTTTQKIREYAQQAPEGTPLTAKELLHLGSRAAVDQALSRLARAGELERIGRGIYVRRIETRFGKRLPELKRVLSEIANRTGETIVSSGAAAANRLGLTTQVPVRQIFLTSGSSRCLRLGSEKVELRHAKPRHLVMPNHVAGEALRALTCWARPDQREGVLQELARKLDRDDLAALVAHRTSLSTREAQTLSTLVSHA